MADNLRNYLKKLLSEIEGINGIYITDKDGVMMIKVTTEDVPEQAVQPYVQSTFISAVQQANKMGMGEAECLVTRYQDMIICQFNIARQKLKPLYATVIGSRDADIGMMMSLESSLGCVVDFLAPLAASRQPTEPPGGVYRH